MCASLVHVTLAERGSPSMSDISPKKSPAFRYARMISCPSSSSMTTDTDPLVR